VHELAQRVSEYVRRHKLLKAGDRVGTAVSGGADSVALLRVLLELRNELGLVLSVVHFHHGLRGAEADADEQFVIELAEAHKLPFCREDGDVKRYAIEKHLSLEAAARKLRYEYFERLLAESVVNRVATGHTLDDQAETVLMRLVRGAGTRGLAGIYPSRQSSVAGRQESNLQQTSVVRPLLAIRRDDLENYLHSLKQDWREDSSNRDLRFARNRIRHGILPRLEHGLNPAVREALAETAEIARAEEEYWEKMVDGTLPLIIDSGGRRDPSTPLRASAGATLVVPTLLELPLALRRRVVRAALKTVGVSLEFHHVEEILDVAAGSAKAAALPQEWCAVRVGDRLEISIRREVEPLDYEYRLPVPGRVEVKEVGITLEAILIPRPAGYNPGQCLEPSLLTPELKVRNWRAGDRFWPPHTKAPKKIKDLLQERHLAGHEKKLWPVVASGDAIVWVRGFAVPAQFGARDGVSEAVMIREERLDGRSGERATK
jgi:tRNA(Ile)-lysidine synthase